MNHFKKGDKVTWTSTSGGYTRTKTGVIEIVVPAEQSPPRMRSKMPMPGMPRDHESYIVKVPGRGYYWPRVSLLKRTEQ